MQREACAFCASDDNEVQGDGSSFHVYCFKCGAHGPDMTTAHRAVDRWNTHAWHFWRTRMQEMSDYAKGLPEPYQTEVFNILANGKPQP